MRADREDDDPALDAAAEELVAETTAYGVYASSGVDPGEYSTTYLASWTEHTPIATIEPTAPAIDRLSCRIENAVVNVNPSSPTTTPRHSRAAPTQPDRRRGAAGHGAPAEERVGEHAAPSDEPARTFCSAGAYPGAKRSPVGEEGGISSSSASREAGS